MRSRLIGKSLSITDNLIDLRCCSPWRRLAKEMITHRKNTSVTGAVWFIDNHGQ